MRVVKGEERRTLIRYLAFHRAEFEVEYEGQRIVPLDRDYIVSALPIDYRDAPLWHGHRGNINIHVSDALVEAVRRQVPSRVRDFKEFG